MARIVCLGEAMLELSRAGELWQMGYGGDTLNTAVHLARGGHTVGYMTALGSDPFSEELRSRWQAEGIDCDLIVTHPTRQAGLYAITTDADGERSFTYWRENSAARAMFEVYAIDEAIAAAETADLFYFSLISLAVLPPQGRQDLLRLAGKVRDRGGIVAFDGNYRPRLWETPEAAIRARDKAIAFADIGLPTLDDEVQLCGAGSALEVAAHWQRMGCREVIVKLGADGCLLPDGTQCPVREPLRPVDTSGAGDAFNGGYLAARMNDVPVTEAALAGHALAGWNVMRRGAIPRRDEAAPYTKLQ
ncbi:2-dehydro-3-deoxygluconokinase [Novosphingobium endophyticum]|uniref:2-dehydro-3-deoxygluconokinase n=1 Tax=Novosphingobium endophyticum TaxID=1955250 RepID=A0A916X2Y6_9SPHN|nr:sugar kinase [Novosphingobium endophyticum]GGB87303.1 2-dehydro-3-deoxygluconokinase [Novosphingobium endophyticum]